MLIKTNRCCGNGLSGGITDTSSFAANPSTVNIQQETTATKNAVQKIGGLNWQRNLILANAKDAAQSTKTSPMYREFTQHDAELTKLVPSVQVETEKPNYLMWGLLGVAAIGIILLIK